MDVARLGSAQQGGRQNARSRLSVSTIVLVLRVCVSLKCIRVVSAVHPLAIVLCCTVYVCGDLSLGVCCMSAVYAV